MDFMIVLNGAVCFLAGNEIENNFIKSTFTLGIIFLYAQSKPTCQLVILFTQ